MHYRAIIVSFIHIIVLVIFSFDEVVFAVLLNVIVDNIDKFVSVTSSLFMPKAEGVEDFMNGGAKLKKNNLKKNFEKVGLQLEGGAQFKKLIFNYVLSVV